MKIIAFVLAVYFMALVLFPCNDNVVHANPNAPTELSQVPTETHSHLDFCSPFCTCNCCGVSFNLQFLKTTTISFKSITYFIDLEAIWKPSFYSNAFFQIWQPPKIS